VHGSELNPPTTAVPYGGVAAGYFITFENGFTVYFSGSSAAMAEQGLWAQMYQPNLAIIHMGAPRLRRPSPGCWPWSDAR
jgi:hypothetical protein